MGQIIQNCFVGILKIDFRMNNSTSKTASAIHFRHAIAISELSSAGICGPLAPNSKRFCSKVKYTMTVLRPVQ